MVNTFPLLPKEGGELVPALPLGDGGMAYLLFPNGANERRRGNTRFSFLKGLGDGQTPSPKGERTGNFLFFLEGGGMANLLLPKERGSYSLRFL